MAKPNLPEVQIVLDSIGSHGIRLTTFKIRAPKFLIAEINTHRVLSRNYNSSRAIPAKKIRKQIISEMYVPPVWPLNQPGMESFDYLSSWRLAAAKAIWRSAGWCAAIHHCGLQFIGLHKEYTNRIVEPYMWAEGVISATDWENFLELRCHHSAQPDFQIVAMEIANLLAVHQPQLLQPGEWHLPFIDSVDRNTYSLDVLKQISAARTARVSYGMQEVYDVVKDIARADKLINSYPPHVSPLENVAQCLTDDRRSGNFTGWLQYRKELSADCSTF